MARYVCPSCGSPFNGKKCKNCAYESFSEEITHRTHVHQGEPLVIQEKTRKPIPYKDPFDCPRQERKKGKRKGLPTAAVIAILGLFLANPFGLLMRRLTGSDHVALPPIPNYSESVSLPLDGATVLDNEDFTVIAQWEDGETTSIPIYIVNHTDREYVFLLDRLFVNDLCLSDFATLYVYAEPGETVAGRLWIEELGLAAGNMAQIQNITFDLEVYDYQDDTAEPIYLKDLTIEGNAAPDYSHTLSLPEPPIYDAKDLVLYALGPTDDYLPEDWTADPSILLCAKNNTDQDMELLGEDIRVNGRETDVVLWAELPARSTAIFRLGLYTAPEEDRNALREITAVLTAQTQDTGWDLGELDIPVERP